MVLEEDGTEVDNEVLAELGGQTLVLLTPMDKWEPALDFGQGTICNSENKELSATSHDGKFKVLLE